MLDSRVGYTGGSTDHPTYESVCANDGHTEALRLEFDPAVLSYEDLIAAFCDDPRVASFNGGPGLLHLGRAQYMTAIWAQDEAQAQTAERVVAASGKVVPVYAAAPWHDAEDYHQHFLGEFKDLPDDDEAGSGI